MKKLENVHYYLKKLISDVARFLDPSLTLQLFKCHAVFLLNMAISNLLFAVRLCLSLALQSLIYDNRPG